MRAREPFPLDPDRARLRGFYRRAWEKARAGAPLEPREAMVAAVIEAHPEYAAIVSDPQAESADFPGVNPYLHLGMHVALHEQLEADRPRGIRRLYPRIVALHPDRHVAEHAILACLHEVLSQAEGDGEGPGEVAEAAYLSALRALAEGRRR